MECRDLGRRGGGPPGGDRDCGGPGPAGLRCARKCWHSTPSPARTPNSAASSSCWRTPSTPSRCSPRPRRSPRKRSSRFNVTATYILARTAQLLRDTDDAVVFYKLFIDQSVQLQSPQQIGEGYTGLIKTFYDGGKYDDSEKACDEFLALKGDPTLQRMQPTVLREMVLVLAKQGKIDKATNLMDRIIKAQPDNPFNLIAKGAIPPRDRQAGRRRQGLRGRRGAGEEERGFHQGGAGRSH